MSGTPNLKKVISIDHDLCIGCGVCVTPCIGGAIELKDGKAHVISDDLCDGAGFCLDICPTGALTLIDREVSPTDALGSTENAGASSLYDKMNQLIADADPSAAPAASQATSTSETATSATATPEAATAVPAGTVRADENDVAHCILCGADEHTKPLLALAQNGTRSWVCTKCLPALIHG